VLLGGELSERAFDIHEQMRTLGADWAFCPYLLDQLPRLLKLFASL
jgi:hypothetical protein